MAKTYFLPLLALLGACASTAANPESAWTAPSLSGTLPTQPSAGEPEAPGAPEKPNLPLGIGLTTGPSTFLLGATFDFPLDKRLTFGPSLQYGFDSDVHLASLAGQLKYYVPISESEPGSFSILPYVTGGVGIVRIDKKGRSNDSGLLLNGGAGIRYLTGEHYRIGSEARLNFMPDKVAGEHGYLSFELLQIVITF